MLKYISFPKQLQTQMKTVYYYFIIFTDEEMWWPEFKPIFPKETPESVSC